MLSRSSLKVEGVLLAIRKRLAIDRIVDQLPWKPCPPEFMICVSDAVLEIDSWIQHERVPHHEYIEWWHTKFEVALISFAVSGKAADWMYVSIMDSYKYCRWETYYEPHCLGVHTWLLRNLDS